RSGKEYQAGHVRLALHRKRDPDVPAAQRENAGGGVLRRAAEHGLGRQRAAALRRHRRRERRPAAAGGGSGQRPAGHGAGSTDAKGTPHREAALRPAQRRARQDAEGSGGPAGHFSVVHFPAREAHSAKAAGRDAADGRRLKGRAPPRHDERRRRKAGISRSSLLKVGISSSRSPVRRRLPAPSKPVAMTVTRTSSRSVSSMTAPKMMLASGSAASAMISAASLTSNSPRLELPVMLSKMPLAPSMDASSKGLDTAALAAFTARSSPEATPMPISAEPALSMMVRTSAKSRLMRPGTVIRSEMPCTPWRSTSSASLNASRMDVRFSAPCSSRSLGMTMSVSTFSRR